MAANISMELRNEHIISEMTARTINTTELDLPIKRLKLDSMAKLLDISVHDWHQYGILYGLIGIGIIGYAIRRCVKSKVNHAGFVRSPA